MAHIQFFEYEPFSLECLKVHKWTASSTVNILNKAVLQNIDFEGINSSPILLIKILL